MVLKKMGAITPPITKPAGALVRGARDVLACCGVSLGVETWGFWVFFCV